MERVKQILLDRGKAIADSRIQDKLNEYELTGDLSDADAKAIADELEGEAQLVGNGLAVSNGNGKASAPATTKGKGKGGRRRNLPTVQDAAKHTASLANEEITNFAEVLDTNLNAWEEDKADELLARVRNAPKNVVGKFVGNAMQEASDVHSFRASAGEFTSEFFPVGFKSET